LAGAREFSLLQNIQTSSDANPASDSIGTGVLSPLVKQTRLEVDHFV